MYGYRNITRDMKDYGEECGKNRVYRIIREANIRAHRGCKKHKGFKSGNQHRAAPNVSKREFGVEEPSKVCVTNFTYVRTYEGWLYLTIVLDLFSRQIISWSMKNHPKVDLVIDALLIAVRQRKPEAKVLNHSDQGVQYTSRDWKSFLVDNNLEISMSRRRNCHDNAEA